MGMITWIRASMPESRETVFRPAVADLERTAGHAEPIGNSDRLTFPTHLTVPSANS